jgi:hypothetical protein
MSPLMKAYTDKVWKLECHFCSLKLEHVPRGQDTGMKDLSWIVAKGLPVPVGAIVEKLSKPSTVLEEEDTGAPPATKQGTPTTTEQQEGTADPASERCISLVPTCWSS